MNEFNTALNVTMFPVSVFASDFTDMSNDWSTPAVCYRKSIINGDHNKILPKNNHTRPQMATILNRAFGSTQEADISNYTDVSADAWNYSDMKFVC